MLSKIFLVLALALSGLLIYAALKDSKMEIARELSINASPEILFPYLNNSEKMNEWMPWKESDPNLKMIYSGPSEGVGSISSWESSGQMGTGRAEIIESSLNRAVETKIEYFRPMVMSQVSIMTLIPNQNDETIVRWAVTGHNSFFFRLIGIFVRMEKIVGKEFEKGLQNLKTIVEKGK